MGLNRTLDDFAGELRAIASTSAAYIYGQNSRIDRLDDSHSVQAPVGIVDFQPDEMTVRCGAGTSLAELDHVVGAHGQYVNLPFSPRNGGGEGGTVGGALAVGRSGINRLGRGPIRDGLLQVSYADAAGRLITAGGPTVKNVSGFDLCRLFVGTFGVFGFMGEVILRTRPLPLASRWYDVAVDDSDRLTNLIGHLYRPSSVLWDGTHVHLCIEGHPLDIDECIAALRSVGFDPAESTEPDLDSVPHRWSTHPTDALQTVARRPGTCWAEIGVGIVHDSQPARPAVTDPMARTVIGRLLDEFNPGRLLNPGLVARVV